MKRQFGWLFAQLCLFGLIGNSIPARADIIDFEDGAYTGNALSAGYHGFNWTNMYGYYGYFVPGTGYEHGVVSGKTMAFNGDATYGIGAKPGIITRDTPFILESVYVTKAWNDGTTRFLGYRDNTLLFSKDVFATTTQPTFATFGWTGIDKIVISDIDMSFQTVIDDLNFSEIPEPASGLIILTGIVAIATSRRKRNHESSN
jgi:hypothetical protein